MKKQNMRFIILGALICFVCVTQVSSEIFKSPLKKAQEDRAEKQGDVSFIVNNVMRDFSKFLEDNMKQVTDVTDPYFNVRDEDDYLIGGKAYVTPENVAHGRTVKDFQLSIVNSKPTDFTDTKNQLNKLGQKVTLLNDKGLFPKKAQDLSKTKRRTVVIGTSPQTVALRHEAALCKAASELVYALNEVVDVQKKVLEIAFKKRKELEASGKKAGGASQNKKPEPKKKAAPVIEEEVEEEEGE